jgi:hypothetical protein
MSFINVDDEYSMNKQIKYRSGKLLKPYLVNAPVPQTDPDDQYETSMNDENFGASIINTKREI